VSYEELRATADSYVTDARDFPAQIPNMGTVVAELASITFDNGNPLRGTGVVFIRGNVNINPGSMSNFRGLLYIDGNFSMRAPALIEGAVVCTGNMTLQGSGDYATIRFNDAILNALRQESGQYRFVGAYHQLHSDQ
jgi:formylmethanofuran dehydrogenase subunit C